MNRFRHSLEKRGYQFVPLQAEGVAQRLHLPPEELLSEIRLLTPDGRLISGGDAMICLAREIWWTKPFYFLSRLPGMRRGIRFVYQHFARHRHCRGNSSALPKPR